MGDSGRSDSGWCFRAPRVLVVDDERPLAEAIAMMLREDCVVDVTHRPTEALAWLRDGREYDMILSDVRMPEMSGLDLLATLRVDVPRMAERVVLMTGGAPPALQWRLDALTDVVVLEKPLDLARLRSLVGAHVAKPEESQVG